MSRAYRITVKETVTREIKAGDEIGTQLELLEILPPEAMGQLLREELKARGFAENDDGTLSRKDGNVTVVVDPCDGEVTVKSEAADTVTVEGSRDATAWNDVGPTRNAVADQAREQLVKDLGKRIDKENEKLQQKATAELEEKLHDIQPELGEIVNKVTREALKQKAAQLGTVMEIAEDDQTGSMTIKVEV
jgi:trans-2-enoyl-CoA reductase